MGAVVVVPVSRVTVVRSWVGRSGDKNTSRLSEKRGDEGRRRTTFGRLDLNTNTRATSRDKYELRVATKHLLYCLQVPEVRLRARKTFPTWGAVQHIKGDGEECERIQGGSQRADWGSRVGRAAEERPAVNGQARYHFLLQVSSGHQV